MTFTPRLDILPPPQLRLWSELIEVPKEFTLYGGTAVALQLGHRQSVDFDFFGSKRFNADTFRMSFLDEAEVLQCDADTVKLPRLEPVRKRASRGRSRQ